MLNFRGVTLQQLIGVEMGSIDLDIVTMLEANDTGVPTDNRHLFVPPNVGDFWWKTKVTHSGRWQVYHGEFHISYTKPPWMDVGCSFYRQNSSVQKFEGSFCLLAKWPLFWMDWLFVTSFVELIFFYGYFWGTAVPFFRNAKPFSVPMIVTAWQENTSYFSQMLICWHHNEHQVKSWTWKFLLQLGRFFFRRDGPEIGIWIIVPRTQELWSSLCTSSKR